MAEKLETWQFKKTGRGERYPWDQWLDGSIWVLTKGEDFDCTITAIRSGAFAAAARRRIKVRTSNPDDQTLILQGYSGGDHV
jgi:hypothetical protein